MNGVNDLSNDEESIISNNITHQDIDYDVQTTDIYKKMEKKRSFYSDKIDEYEKLILEQKKQIEELKERKNTLKYNLETKQKVTNHISNIYGLIFEKTKLPMMIHGDQETVLSWNRAAAVNLKPKFYFLIIKIFEEHCGYDYDDLHSKVNYGSQLIREKGLVDNTMDNFYNSKELKGRSFLFPTLNHVNGVMKKVVSIVEIYDEFAFSVVLGTQILPPIPIQSTIQSNFNSSSSNVLPK